MKAPRAEQQENPFQARWAVLSGANRRRDAPKRARRNVFADRRIGEDNPSLPEEDRYLARLQRERTRRTKKRARYALEEDDGGVEDKGVGEKEAKHSLLRDDYDEAEAQAEVLEEDGEESSDDGGDDFLTVKQTAGGDGEVGDAERAKTRQEVMAEVMLKSKMYKAKRQQDKHEADEQTAKLDEELPDIMRLLVKSGEDYAKSKAAERNLLVSEEKVSIFEEEEDQQVGKGTMPPPPPRVDAKFSYERVYQQLAAEKRARPSDRLLTEEEKAEKELEELEEMERMRTQLMHNAGDSDVEDERSPRQLHITVKKERLSAKKKGRPAGGDDLDDGFELSANDEEGNSENEDSDIDAHAPSDGNPDSNEAPSSAEEAEEEEIDPNTMFGAEEEENEEEGEHPVPFVFKHCPTSPSQLQKLFESRTLPERETIIDRLRKCFAVSLNPHVNIKKLDGLLECLLLRIESLAMVSSTNLKRAVAEIDMLLIHVHALGKRNEALVVGWARDKIAYAFHSLAATKKTNGLYHRWGIPTLLILRTVGRIFPSTDLRHPISTPLTLLLSEGLAMSRMLCCKDIGTGCFVGWLLLEQMAGASRYSGQLTTFLTSVLCGGFSAGSPDLKSMFATYREHRTKGSARKLRLVDLAKADHEDPQSEQTIQAMILQSALCLVDAATMSNRLGHQDIVFQNLPLKRLPQGETRTNVLKALVSSRETRKALALYTMSAAATVRKSLNPKFSAESGVFRRAARTSYHAARSGDMSQSAMRVRRALKKEERGWARDVRQSAMARQTERAREDGEKRERGEKRAKEAMAFLETQQATWKKAEKRQKMLSGKKW